MMRKKTCASFSPARLVSARSAFAGAAWWVASLGPPPLGKNLDFSTSVVDREGRLLRAYATSEGRWRLPATVADVDPRFFDVLFAYEDKRFRVHHGVDPRAVLRAALQFATSGHLRSGASTLTMQVARLLEPPEVRRSMVTKLRQMVRAIEIERALTKDEILALYLDLAPYGGNIEGIRAASLAYFGKEPRRLSLGEAALLGGVAAIAGAAPAGSLRRERARRARPRARPLRRDRCRAGRRDRARQDRAGAERPPPDADAGAARRRQGRRRSRRNQRCIGSPSTPSCRRIWKISRASACARLPRRSAPTSRSPFSPSTTQPARFWPASARPIISTCAAPARST